MLVKIIHLQFQKKDQTVTEGHREGVNEPAQRQQAAIARPSAAPYQHLFYSARVRNTKGQSGYSSAGACYNNVDEMHSLHPFQQTRKWVTKKLD